ncbi:MAG: DNA repair protein RadC [Kovacikia sp.]
MTFHKVADSAHPGRWNTLRAQQNIDSLTTAELIQILLDVSLETAQGILERFGNCQLLCHAIDADLIAFHGINSRKAARFLAAIELGKRVYASYPSSADPIDDPEIAAKRFIHCIGYSEVERFAVLSLDIKHREIAIDIISVGTKTETVVPPREIFRMLLRRGATRAILAHCHPSREVQPSPEDIRTTRGMLQAGNFVNIPILDHIIVGGSNWTSMRTVTNLWHEIPQGDYAQPSEEIPQIWRQ